MDGFHRVFEVDHEVALEHQLALAHPPFHVVLVDEQDLLPDGAGASCPGARALQVFAYGSQLRLNQVDELDAHADAGLVVLDTALDGDFLRAERQLHVDHASGDEGTADVEEMGLYADPIESEVALGFLDPGGSNTDFRLFRVTKDGRVRLRRFKQQLEREDYDKKNAIRYLTPIADWVGGRVNPRKGDLEGIASDYMFPFKVLCESHREEYLELVFTTFFLDSSTLMLAPESNISVENHHFQWVLQQTRRAQR